MIIQSNTIKAKFDGAENFESIEVGFDKTSIAHFFRMVANLYTDPVTAVLRELGANCVDAIKEAGKDGIAAGWELHLPNTFSPTVKFVDHGVGLSDERMRSIYSVIGGSSKRGDANQIGGFGVGRLSLFALTNTCTVVSRYNGKKTRYFIHIQPNGLPDIKPVSSEETKERNGVEVSFDLQNQHINDFVAKYAHVYHYFPHRPKILIGGKVVEGNWAAKVEAQIKGKDWEISKGQSKIVMGGIQYAVPQNMIEGGKLSKFSSMTKYGVVIYAEIGDFSITPSREAIQFDDLTISRLGNKLKEISDALVPVVEKKVQSAKNLMEAKLILRKVKGEMPFVGSVKVNIQGITVDDTDIDLSWIGKNTDKVLAIHKQAYYAKKTTREESPVILGISENHIVLINDLKRGFISRFVAYAANLKQASGSSYYYRSVPLSGYFINPSAENEFRAKTQWFGHIAKASDFLPKAPSSTSNKSRDYSKSLFFYNGKKYGRTSDMISEVDAKKIAKGSKIILFPIFNAEINGVRPDTFMDQFNKIKGALNLTPVFVHQSKFDEIDVDSVSETLGFDEVEKFNDWAKDNMGYLIKVSRTHVISGNILGFFINNQANLKVKLPNSVMKLVASKKIQVIGAYYNEPRSADANMTSYIHNVFRVVVGGPSRMRRLKKVESLVKNILVQLPLLSSVHWGRQNDGDVCAFVNATLKKTTDI